MNQTTIQRVVTCSGIGLHSGNKVYLALRPASANTGIIFDIHTPDGIRRVSPAPKAVATTVLATTLGSNGATVSTVEHLLASVLGLGIDNLIISVEGGEIPIMDAPFLPGLLQQRSFLSPAHASPVPGSARCTVPLCGAVRHQAGVAHPGVPVGIVLTLGADGLQQINGVPEKISIHFSVLAKSTAVTQHRQIAVGSAQF